MGKSHISMIEDTFQELGKPLTLNEAYNYINKRWFRIAPTKQKVANLLSSRPQFLSVETTTVTNSKGEPFTVNLWEHIN